MLVDNMIQQITLQFVEHYGYIGIFVAMAIESACIPLPSEVIMPFGGYMVEAGHLNFWAVVFMGILGNLAGSLVAFFIGKYAGREVIRRYGRFMALSEKHVQWAEKWFERRGSMTVFVARLLPAIRTVISLPAGIASMPLFLFVIYTLSGSFLWSLVLTIVGLQLGREWANIQHFTHPLTYSVLFVIVVIVLFSVIKTRKQQAP